MTEFRRLTELDELRACVALQRVTWGEGFSDVVPASVLQVSQKIGGLVGGALEDGALVGFVYSLLGRFAGTISHWSHMLAVDPEARGRGLGRRLKLYQRDTLLEDGIDTIFWTFDPLVARNAHLNLNRLGASVSGYVPNMYGGDTGSPLHAGGDTDRLIVRWDLESQRALWAIGEDRGAVSVIQVHEESAVTRPEGSAGPGDELPEGDQVFVEIPSDLERAVASGVDLTAWRARVRAALTTYLRRGYAIQSLVRDTAADRSYYQLRRV